MKENFNSITVYSAKICPFAQRVRILLNLKNIEFELIEIDLDNKPKWFQELSPHGKVPVIKHYDKVVYESSVVNEYLEEILPTPPLLSEDPYQKALMRILIAYCNSEFIPAFYRLLSNEDTAQYSECKQNLMKCLYFLENEGFKHANLGPYFFGKEISLVDITFYPFFERFVVNEYYRNAAIPKDCFKLRNWIKTMFTVPVIAGIRNTPEFYINRYAKFAKAEISHSVDKKLLDDLWD